jgi:hypothetical protein
MRRVLWWGAGLIALEAALVAAALGLTGSAVPVVAFLGVVAGLLARLLGVALVVALMLIPVVGVIALALRRVPARMVDRDPRGEAAARMAGREG